MTHQGCTLRELSRSPLESHSSSDLVLPGSSALGSDSQDDLRQDATWGPHYLFSLKLSRRTGRRKHRASTHPRMQPVLLHHLPPRSGIVQSSQDS